MRFSISQRELLRIVCVALLGLLAAISIRVMVCQVYVIVGRSMEPTLYEGNRVVVLKVSPIKRGDIVVLRAPDGSGKEYVKRVIGLPNETILFVEEYTLIDGISLNENYARLERLPNEKFIQITCGPNQYAVCGDNRPDSHDSRAFGPINKEMIIGEVIYQW